MNNNINFMQQAETSNTTTTTTTTLVSNNAAPSIAIWFRQARQRTYFQLKAGQVLYCEPYKYNLRLSGVNPKLPEQSLFSFDLFVKQKSNKDNVAPQFVPLGVQLDKQLLQVRGAPQDTIDYRISFHVQSRAYADSVFFLRIKDCTESVVCHTVDFVIGGRGKKRSNDKKLQQQQQQQIQQEQGLAE